MNTSCISESRNAFSAQMFCKTPQAVGTEVPTTKNASRTEVREAMFKSRFHSHLSLKEAVNAGRAEGFHIPRARGRTSQFHP